MQAGLTQQQLADNIGVTKSVISFYERQERTPSPDVLIKLSSIFHVSTDFLLGVDKVSRLDVSGLDERELQLVSMLVELLRSKHT